VAGAEVLELGCGSGELLRLAAEAGAARVIGVDNSPAAVRLAQRMLKGLEHTLVLADVFALADVPRADIVWSSGLLEHFRGQRALELMRVHARLALRDVVVVVPASPHWNDIRMRRSRTLRTYGWQLPVTAGRLKELGASAGLRLRSIRRFMPAYGLRQSFSPSFAHCIERALAWSERWTGGLVIAAFGLQRGLEQADAIPRNKRCRPDDRWRTCSPGAVRVCGPTKA